MNTRIEKTKALEFELTLIKGITVETGESLVCSVRRVSDGFWWDGAAFTNTTYTTNAMTELTGDDGLEARYAFTLPATNTEDIYQFRMRHTFSGDASASIFEVEVETYSEQVDAPRQQMTALSGSIVRLSAFLQEGGIPILGETLNVSIQRQSDKRWWTGTVFQLGYRTVTMIEQTGNVAEEGEYTYLFTLPATILAEAYHWSAKYDGPPAQYSKGVIRTADVNIFHIDASREAAQDFRAAVKTVTRGRAVGGTLTLTEMTTDLTETTNNHYRGRAMYWEDGPLKDSQTQITAYDGNSKKLSYRQVTDVPLVGNKFVIV